MLLAADDRGGLQRRQPALSGRHQTLHGPIPAWIVKEGHQWGQQSTAPSNCEETNELCPSWWHLCGCSDDWKSSWMFERENELLSGLVPSFLLPRNKATAQTGWLFEPQLQSTPRRVLSTLLKAPPPSVPHRCMVGMLSAPLRSPAPRCSSHSRSSFSWEKKDVHIGLLWENITALFHSLLLVNISGEEPGRA